MTRCCTFIACCFVLLLSSCADRAIQVRLEAADSLMWSAPDSAHHILQAVAPDSLSTDRQRAYYGLLLTQAQYRTYVPLTSDSLILRSVFYYEGRDDYKYGLSLYYLGAVYQEKEFYNLAIKQYKRALEYFFENDHPRMVALVNSALGDLYNNQFFQDEAKACYNISEKLFCNVGDSINLGYLYAKISDTYRMRSVHDSALLFLERSLHIARQVGNERQALAVQANMALDYFRQGDVARSKRLLDHLFFANSINKPSPKQCVLRAEIAFSEKKVDSACYYLGLQSSASLLADKLNSQLCFEQERYAEARELQKRYFSQTAKIWEERDRIRVDEIAAQYDYDKVQIEKTEVERKFISSLWIGLLTACSLCVVIISLHRRHQNQIVAAKNLMEILKVQNESIQLDQRNERVLKLRKIIEKRMAVIGEIIALSYESKNNEKLLNSRIADFLSADPLRSEAFKDILDVVNDAYGGLVDYLKQQAPLLSKTDLTICALTVVGYSSHQLFVIMNTKNVGVIYNKKHRIGLKLGSRGDLREFLLSVVSRNA